MKRINLVMNVDFFDELALHEGSMGPADVEALVAECKANGIDTMYWRVIGLGTAGYPSRIVAGADWAATADFSLSVARMSPAEQQDYHARKGRPWGGRLVDTLSRMDPVVEARDACRRHGIKFHIWLDVIDERRNRFLLEHPECLVHGRDGRTVWPGLRDYANPAAVGNMLAVVDELVAYKPDGLYLSTSCHTRHLNFPEPDDFFGFGPAIAAAYQRETGRDILDEPLDPVAWNRVKGDAFTEFLRQVKERLAPIGGKLAVGTQYGPQTILTTPFFSTHVPFRFDTQWRRWIDEGIADTLVLGDYEWPWDRVPIWEAKQVFPPAGLQAADVLTPEYVAYAAGRAELLIFSSWLSAYAQHHQGASAGNLEDAMRMRARTVLETGADGLCLHEAHTFEHYKGFDTVAEMRHTFDAGSINA
jgi:hypothetical protein